MRALAIALVLVAALASATQGADATGRITGMVVVLGPDGKPAAAEGAIVYVVGFDEPPPDKPAVVLQRDKKFIPDLIAVTAGQEVAFPNGDTILHNVFSRSAARPFDLGQYKKGESKTKAFPKPGVIDVYCNIHPEMAATVVVVPNRAHGRVAADGSFAIAGVQPGRWTVFAYTRLATRPARGEVTVVAGGDATVQLQLQRGASAGHKNKFGEPYRESGRYR